MNPIAVFYWKPAKRVPRAEIIEKASDLSPELFPQCVEGQLLFLAGNGMFGDLRRQVEAIEDAHRITVRVSEFHL